MSEAPYLPPETNNNKRRADRPLYAVPDMEPEVSPSALLIEASAVRIPPGIDAPMLIPAYYRIRDAIEYVELMQDMNTPDGVCGACRALRDALDEYSRIAEKLALQHDVHELVSNSAYNSDNHYPGTSWIHQTTDGDEATVTANAVVPQRGEARSTYTLESTKDRYGPSGHTVWVERMSIDVKTDEPKFEKRRISHPAAARKVVALAAKRRNT